MNKGINNTLVIKLKKIDREFHKYLNFIQFTERTFGRESKKYKYALALNALQTLALQSELDKLITKYGYPGKGLVGDEFLTAFSIIDSASVEYKWKYYDLIIDAADNGELDWINVAFFVDKVKVARNENQVYGTQFKYDQKCNKKIYYPIEQIEKLNERRKKAGLDTMDNLNNGSI